MNGKQDGGRGDAGQPMAIGPLAHTMLSFP